ncbi:hypothetical protein SmB9_07960 [Sphingosinicella microcystinivorans]|uniref:Uncharacterized protein n=1 Tax=Sphingosinicella microcystinivorans TaxID=335406 RepID=A0AAD1D4G3_SPHMI|nr:hypothetical protein SmB9_07960 [Sphingosinicella microcystinivorans]
MQLGDILPSETPGCRKPQDKGIVDRRSRVPQAHKRGTARRRYTPAEREQSRTRRRARHANNRNASRGPSRRQGEYRFLFNHL